MNTDSLFLCLNAEAGKIPAKLNLLPAGDFVAGRDGRRWTKRNPEVIAQKSNEYLPQHLIDENHSTDLKASKGDALHYKVKCNKRLHAVISTLNIFETVKSFL